MNELPLMAWPILILMAMLMGLVAERTNLCTVGAVAEIMVERRAHTLWNITRIVLWVFGISLFLGYLFELTPLFHDRFHLGWTSLLGGLLFGFGAALNGGCSLQTITRLGRGDLGMMLSILGMPMGAMLVRPLLLRYPAMLPTRDTDPVGLPGSLQLFLLAALAIWMILESVRVLRGFRFSSFRARLLAPNYLPASSAALLGVANGAIFAVVGTWMFTFVLIQTLTNLAFRDSPLYRPIPEQLWWLLAAYLLGIFGSAIQSRHTLFQSVPQASWFRYFVAGNFMGLGAALVPGGNDMILLNGIPGLSSHALPAYLAMLAGIGMTLALTMRFFPDRELC